MCKSLLFFLLIGSSFYAMNETQDSRYVRFDSKGVPYWSNKPVTNSGYIESQRDKRKQISCLGYYYKIRELFYFKYSGKSGNGGEREYCDGKTSRIKDKYGVALNKDVRFLCSGCADACCFLLSLSVADCCEKYPRSALCVCCCCTFLYSVKRLGDVLSFTRFNCLEEFHDYKCLKKFHGYKDE